MYPNPPKYLINKPHQLDLLADFMQDQPIFAYDTETNGTTDRFKVQIVGLSLGFDLFGVYIPLNHLWEDTPQLFTEQVFDKLEGFFVDKEVEKICHNAKFDEMVLRRHGLVVEGKAHDTFILAWMLQNHRQRKGEKGLKHLTLENLGYRMRTFEDVVEKVQKSKRDYNFARVSPDEAASYAADDAYWTYQLYYNLLKRIKAEKLLPAYNHVDRPFNRVVGNIERHGVAIDRKYLAEAAVKFPEIMDNVDAEIYKDAGKVFNIGAPKQLGTVLYEELKVQGDRSVPRTKTGWSTDKKTLEKFRTSHPIVTNVLKRKKLAKTHSVFVEGLQERISEDGRLHARFNGCGTVTGRLSSSNPNLQQVEGGVVEDIRIRNFFVAAPGHVFVISDYSQVELRVMAHFSKDENMINGFLSGVDFHEATARGMLKIKGEVDRHGRTVAKTINFGVGYGRGPNSIAEQLGCSNEEAQQFIVDYFRNFARLGAYKKHVISKARQDGFVRTITGRKRKLLPDIRSDNWKLRGGAERQAFSTKIQGSAADIIKMSMIQMEPELDSLKSKICIQIHDELVVESLIENAEETAALMKDNMEKPFQGKNPLCVPLVTEPVIVEKWGDAK